MAKKLTFLLWNRIGSLECILPVFFLLKKKHPDLQLNIVIIELSKEIIIGESRFYDMFCKENSIKLVDKINFLFSWLSPFRIVFRFITSIHLRYGSTKSTSLLARLIRKLFPYLQGFLQSNINYQQFAKIINESDILLINEAWWKNLDKAVLDIVSNYVGKIFIIPHGPVFLTLDGMYSTEDITSLGIHFEVADRNVISYQKLLPFVPMTISFHQLGISNDDRSIHAEFLGFAGYPSFDNFWFDMMKEMNGKSKFRYLVTPKQLPFRCLFLLRNVVDATDAQYRTTHKELIAILNNISVNILERYPVELLVKPHPIQNLSEIGRNS